MVIKRRGKKLLRGFAFLILLIPLFLIINILYCNNVLTYSFYSVETAKLKHDARFVMISDTEGRSFGKGNYKLTEKIMAAEPDFVLLVGDMVDENEPHEADDLVEMCKTLAKEVPVYYTLGNHEDLSFVYEGGKQTSDFKKLIDSTGAKLLYNDMEDIKLNGDRITIAGIKQYPFYGFDSPDFDNPENHLLQRFLEQEDDEHFSILMCHFPVVIYWKFDEFDIDLMVCGHNHGGIVRIPFKGGIYGPEQGWFPQYDLGYYKVNNMQAIITGGLNNAHHIPRINNPLDVTVVDLKAVGQ